MRSLAGTRAPPARHPGHQQGPTRAQREKRFRTQKRQQQNENKHISRRKHARRRRGKHGGQGGGESRHCARVRETRQLRKVASQTTQKPASAPPRTCRTAPTVLLSVEDMPRTPLSAGRRRATLIRQAAPSPRAKATIGAMRGAWRVAVVWVLSCMGSEGGATADLHCACLGGQ